MPPEVLRELKLETLAIVAGSFVASDLRDRHSDLLLSVELANPLKTTKRKAVQRALIYTWPQLEAADDEGRCKSLRRWHSCPLASHHRRRLARIGRRHDLPSNAARSIRFAL